MNINILEVRATDTVMVTHNIGNTLPSEVDAYCDKIMEKLKVAFGKATIVMFPIREGDTWDFTVVRKAS